MVCRLLLAGFKRKGLEESKKEPPPSMSGSAAYLPKTLYSYTFMSSFTLENQDSMASVVTLALIATLKTGWGGSRGLCRRVL
jgi:hypothetical protein